MRFQQWVVYLRTAVCTALCTVQCILGFTWLSVSVTYGIQQFKIKMYLLIFIYNYKTFNVKMICTH
jgi:hypothetical protein